MVPYERKKWDPKAIDPVMIYIDLLLNYPVCWIVMGRYVLS